MPIEATVGQILVNSALPPKYRNYNRVMDKKNLFDVLNKIAREQPEIYKDVLKKYREVTSRAAFMIGSKMGLDDFILPDNVKKEIFDAEKLIEKHKNDEEKLVKEFTALQKKIEKRVLDEALKRDNALALQLVSGARGKPSQLNSTIGTPVMYADHKGRPIKLPIKRSFAEGLTPAEYFASSYGTRKGVISTKFATPDGGYFGKQLGFVSGSLVVVMEDCGTDNGIDVSVDDPEIFGRLLARPVKNFPKDTVLTPEITADLKRQGVKKVIIRSPITCEAENGVCQKCRGYDERGKFYELGANPGVNSAAALSESATQAAMNVKHTGGQIATASKGGKRQTGAPTGFKLIQQLLHIPKAFPGGATVSQVDGEVEEIKEAPQGGWYVTVNKKTHYVLPQFDLLVKKGDKVEAGQPLSSGIVNPAEVTKLRGLGEGRRFLTESLKSAYADDGQKINRVHMEVLSRALLNYVRVNDDKFLNDHLPGDVITVQKAQKYYNPPKELKPVSEKLIGKYIAKPILHYTAGTKIRSSIIRHLKSVGIDKIYVTDQEPPFTAVMIRLDDAPAYNENWVQRLFSIQLKKKILEATHKSEKAKIHDVAFVPSYITATEFGRPKVEY